MRVHLTYDVEIWCGGWSDLDKKFPAAFRRYVYGPGPEESGALPLNLRILRDHGLKGIFFVEPLFSFRFGLEPLRELLGVIRDAGQEVQLHMHPEWLDELSEPLVPPRPKTQNMHQFSRAEQGLLLDIGARRLEEAGVPRPTAFRGGGFSMNADTLRALADKGFAVDSSLNSAYSFPYPDGNSARHHYCSRLEGVAEFPITTFRDGFGRVRPMHITACSASEMESTLSSVRDLGLPAATLVSHNFELLTVGQRRVDRVVTRRFDRLCSWLARHADEFETGGFDPTLAPEDPPTWEPPNVSPYATATRYLEQAIRRLM